MIEPGFQYHAAGLYLGPYVAASIAGADPWKTGWSSFRFAKMLYVLPLLFAFTPILMTGSVQVGLWVMVTAIFGMMAFAGWSTGWLHRRMSWPEWFVAGVVALFCFLPPTTTLPADLRGWQMNIVGILGLAAIYRWQRMWPYVGVKVGTA